MTACKAESKIVTVWACSECAQHFKRREDADKHCTCAKCGTVVEKRERSFGGSDSCRRCCLKDAIRHSQENVRRAEKTLADQTAHIAKLRAEKAALDAEAKS